MPAENEAVPGGGASERREETEPERKGLEGKRTEPGRVWKRVGWWFVVQSFGSSSKGSSFHEEECEGAGSSGVSFVEEAF